MKITKKEIKECEMPNWSKTTALELFYSHRWETWKIQVLEFIESDYKNILKQLREKVKDAYNIMKEQWQ